MAHTPLDVLPDANLAVIQYLRSLTQITTLVASDHIISQIPTVPSYPYILVQLAGGQGVWPGLDKPTVQIDCMGGLQEDANLIARTVRAAIWAISNDVVTEGILASGFDEMPPSWMPDMSVTPPISRYTARYKVILH